MAIEKFWSTFVSVYLKISTALLMWLNFLILAAMDSNFALLKLPFWPPNCSLLAFSGLKELKRSNTFFQNIAAV